MDFSALFLRLNGLSVFRSLRKHPLISEYLQTLCALQQSAEEFALCYGSLCEKLFSCPNITNAIVDAIRFDTNVLTGNIENPSQAILAAADKDIETINMLLSANGKELKNAAARKFEEETLCYLAEFSANEKLPFETGKELLSFYQAGGYGFFAQSTAFCAMDDGSIAPVFNMDSVLLRDLPGYELQKQKIVQNTLSFLDGKEANNILLYGDKGTGKSSTVKAVVNAYKDRGLKIIQLSPSQISLFPQICEQIRISPFFFLLFLDDLAFENEDKNFAALKAFIEGGLSASPKNLLIYATSNRRHLVKERFSDRNGDEVRVRDSLETVTSLSDRFGLEITFSVPDKEEYLHIVDCLAAENNISLDKETLSLLAERFAIRRNGRSPRTAHQFIRGLLAEDVKN